MHTATKVFLFGFLQLAEFVALSPKTGGTLPEQAMKEAGSPAPMKLEGCFVNRPTKGVICDQTMQLIVHSTKGETAVINGPFYGEFGGKP